MSRSKAGLIRFEEYSYTRRGFQGGRKAMDHHGLHYVSYYENRKARFIPAFLLHSMGVLSEYRYPWMKTAIFSIPVPIFDLTMI
jgi:hypothetical protein